MVQVKIKLHNIRMNFVKTHIYKQEYTDRGVSESIDEARREEDIAEAERLSKLPEFRLNPNITRYVTKYAALLKDLELSPPLRTKKTISTL